MRKVYQPPQIEKSSVGTWLLALTLTFAVFLSLPLTQMMSAARHEPGDVTTFDVVAPPPPPPPVETEPEPEEEPEPEPEEMPQDDSLPQMSLSQLELAVGGGMGNGVGIGLGLQTASNMVAAIDVFDLSQVDKPPTATMVIEPRYPRELQQQKAEGTVVLVFILDEKGRVNDPKVEKTAHPGFERPALDAVRQWMFEPAVKDGKPVRARVRQSIRFRPPSA